MILQGKGRYHDHTPFDAMEPMGIWFENFALPVVINECLLQSHDGVIHLFPHWPDCLDASFHSLRAVGAFLVSASLKGGRVVEVTIHSETGGRCEVVNPWPDCAVSVVGQSQPSVLTPGHRLAFDTRRGHAYTLEPVTALAPAAHAQRGPP